MSGFLLDTCAVSEALKPKPNRGFAHWLSTVDSSKTYLSVITLGEIRKGVEMLGNSRRRTAIEAWLTSSLPAQFAGKILVFDEYVADRWGRMIAFKGVTLSPIDSMIAATALHHNLSVATRNESDFKPTGVPTTNPWV